MTPTARVSESRAEQLIAELMTVQGWDIRRPPQGDVLTQQEYRDVPTLREALAASSKSGPGGGIPEAIIVERDSYTPLAVFEGKARASDLSKAIADAEGYGDGFRMAGYTPLVVAVAGTRDDTFALRVRKWNGDEWANITYEDAPVSWIPNREQIGRILASPTLFELRPVVPGPEVLKARADEINGLLREAGLKDDFRPAAVGAIMLALWRSQGNIRRDKDDILGDINGACAKAFEKAGKPELAHSIRVDEANTKLAIRARRICEILERLNITTLTAEHDYLGALYEEFFRYTGGNTIGQYFTPRHITRLMAELTEVTRNDVALDPACGTGGFLIAAMQRMQEQAKLPREQVVGIVKEKLIGIEHEPVTAALCVANMILRGDGSTGVIRADAFDDSKYPFDKASVVLMNPPFPHAKTDVPPELFINRALDGLRHRGLAAIIVPSSLLTKGDKARWRRTVLVSNTLRGVISLPNELFQPYAATTTAMLLIEHGVPHAADSPVFFARIANDGFRLKKGVRVPIAGSQLADLIHQFRAGGTVPEFCTSARLTDAAGWSPGGYIPARALSDTEVQDEIGDLIRSKTAFVVRYAPQLARLRRMVAAGQLIPKPYIKRHARWVGSNGEGTIGDYFDIYYGQKSLHSKEHLEPGPSLIISSSGANNGAYGFFDFADLIEPPFVTVPSTGSIGEASVQEFPCGVTDDCLLLFPREGTTLDHLYTAAATLRRERWRFDYGRKMTPERIEAFPLRLDDELTTWVRKQRETGMTLEQSALRVFDTHDDGEQEAVEVEAEAEGFTREDFEAALRKVSRKTDAAGTDDN